MIRIQSAAVHSLSDRREQMVDILHCLGHAILRAGILEAEHHGGQTRHGMLQDLWCKILIPGHIHCGAQAVLEQLALRVFIKMLRLHNELEVRIVHMVPHQIRLPFGLQTASG